MLFAGVELKKIGKTNVVARVPSENIGQKTLFFCQCFCKGGCKTYGFCNVFLAPESENIGRANAHQQKT